MRTKSHCSCNRSTIQDLYNNYTSDWTAFRTKVFDSMDICKELYLLIVIIHTFNCDPY